MKINEKRKLVFLRERQIIYNNKLIELNKKIERLIDSVDINNISEDNKKEYANYERERYKTLELIHSNNEQLNDIYSKLN